MERFGLRLLTLAEQLRMSLDELEADEGDPGRLQRLYRVDHAVTRMRRACRDLRTLAGRAEEELSGADTPLLDVIRMALSAIDRYTQVTIGRVAEFGVLGYAADDVASLLAALLDNATRYSPGVTSVSAHLTESGSLLFRISDSGIGMDPDGIAALNAMLAGDVPGPDDRTARHTGFPVVHRLARKHSIGVRLAARPAPGSGTIAMVTVPPGLICELPREVPPPPAPSGPPGASPPGDGVSGESSVPAGGGSVSVLPTGRRVPPEPPSGASREPGEDAAVTAVDAIAADPASGRTRPGLPRRERASLRGAGHPGGAGHPDGADHPGDGAGPPAPPPATPSAERLAAARPAFADDLTAFSLGAAPGSQVPGTRVPEPQDPGQGAPS
ncbi:MAG: hypothetical protein J2P26_09320 [Nocardiopsaceae bacterium]|nr:hypothetical protein [Nocardiopsaceae bacterium]